MRIGWLLAVLVACSDTTPIPSVELGLDVRLDRNRVSTAEPFEVTVVRTWSRELEPAEFDPSALAPLFTVPVETSRRESSTHVQETRVLRAWAFTRSSPSLDGLEFRARPRAGGKEVLARAGALELVVVPRVDADSPGPPESPDRPYAAPAGPPAWPWALALLAFGLGFARWRARDPLVEQAAAPDRPDPWERARARLAELSGSRDPRDLAERLAALLRELLASEIEGPIEALTTPELLQRCSEELELGARSRQELEELLAWADRLRFKDPSTDGGDWHERTDELNSFLDSGGAR